MGPLDALGLEAKKLISIFCTNYNEGLIINMVEKITDCIFTIAIINKRIAVKYYP
jgi:hypothetical protein